MSDVPFDPISMPPAAPPPRKRRRRWPWVILAIFVALFGALAAVGTWGPDTKIYAGNEVPARFLSTLRGLGVLEEGEKIRWFYSSAILDIRSSFCFVSDRKVVAYSSETEPKATMVPFDQIAAAELSSSTTWMLDGAIGLSLKDGGVVSFEVSSEQGRDKKFLAAIEEGMGRSR